MITLDSIDYSLHSIQIKDAAGDALAISAGGAALVESVDLDIRDLTHVSDSVKVGDGSDFLAIAADGSIAVTDNGASLTVDAVDLDIRDLTHASDSVKVGDGTDFLAVNADGSINVQTIEAGYASWSVVAASVDTTAGGTQLVSSPLSSRLRVEIQNLGSNDVYLRHATGVTTANGLKLPKGSSYEQALDAGAAIWAIAASGTADLRIAQYAA